MDWMHRDCDWSMCAKQGEVLIASRGSVFLNPPNFLFGYSSAIQLQFSTLSLSPSLCLTMAAASYHCRTAGCPYLLGFQPYCNATWRL